MVEKLPVIELFGPTLQGEGALCGKTSYFIRFGGCTYRCKWCDSMHAVDPEQISKNATRMDEADIAKKITGLGGPNRAVWVTLSGGDPCIYDLRGLVLKLAASGMRVAVETQGAFYKPWLQYCQAVTCSPKAPSSGMSEKTDLKVLKEYVGQLGGIYIPTGGKVLNFKVVVFDEEDLLFAAEIHKKFKSIPFYLSVGTTALNRPESPEEVTTGIMERFRWLSAEALASPVFADATVLPQMHAMLWGHQRGV